MACSHRPASLTCTRFCVGMVSSYELESRLFTLGCAGKSSSFSERYDLTTLHKHTMRLWLSFAWNQRQQNVGRVGGIMESGVPSLEFASGTGWILAGVRVNVEPGKIAGG